MAQSMHSRWHSSPPCGSRDGLLDDLLREWLSVRAAEHPLVAEAPSFGRSQMPLLVRTLHAQLSLACIEVRPAERHHLTAP